MPFNIEPLSSRHNLKDFDCGEDSMNRYLRHFAWQNDKIGLSRTFVVVEDGEKHVKGYYALSSGNITYDDVPGEKKGWPKYPVPIVLIGRFAADLRARGQRLGEMLLIDALKRSAQVSNEVGCYAVVVDALNDRARDFYLKYGFMQLDKRLRLFLLTATIKELNLVSP